MVSTATAAAVSNLLPISNNYYCCLLCGCFAGRRGSGNLFWNLLPMTDKYEATQACTTERARWYRIGIGLLELWSNRIRRRHCKVSQDTCLQSEKFSNDENDRRAKLAVQYADLYTCNYNYYFLFYHFAAISY